MDERFSVSVELLANRPEFVSAIGKMRWTEWGRTPERADLEWWVDVTEREAGRDVLPVTFVAVTCTGVPVGAVGLDTLDLEELHDRSPWVVGTIVRGDWRRRGVGAILMTHLEAWAADREMGEVWVATGPSAVDFYKRCGYSVRETLQQRLDDLIFVLSKRIS